MAGKVENKKLGEYENENYCLLWWASDYNTQYSYLVTHQILIPTKRA